MQQMIPNMVPLDPTSITNEQIQKVPNSASKESHVSRRIADTQPQATAMPAQLLAPHPAMQQAGFYIQHPPAAAAMVQQQGLSPQNMEMQYSSPQQMHEAQHPLHQEAMRQMGMRPGGANRMPGK